jgi:GT2 family glycosyltransferase
MKQLVWLVAALFVTYLLVPLLQEEAWAWCPVVARRLVRVAACLVPFEHRDRYREEWLAEVEAFEGRNLSMVVMATRILLFAPTTGLALRGRMPQGMPAPTGAGPQGVRVPLKRTTVATQPRVLAIVVLRDGGSYLRDVFRGLAAQTRPIDDVLILDAGSTDGSADWARSRLGDDAVMAVRGQFGRAVMSALRDPRTSGMDWLWLLHDDCAPEPEALERLLAEAESRPSASILGPKLVPWDEPRGVPEIGFSVDRTGRAVSPIEPDEVLDQGQHDQIQDVFFINTAGMLVRRMALLNVGGFDERMPAFRDDLDLCWRMHIIGGRVLMVPQARVRHFGAVFFDTGETPAISCRRYLIERHTVAAMLKATSLRRLPLALLLALTGALLRSAGLALTGRRIEAMEVLWAWGWNVKELRTTMMHRRRLQRRRKVDDSALDPLRARGGQTLRCFVRQFRNYLEACFPSKSYEPSRFDGGSNMWGC